MKRTMNELLDCWIHSVFGQILSAYADQKKQTNKLDILFLGLSPSLYFVPVQKSLKILFLDRKTFNGSINFDHVSAITIFLKMQ